jgi:hypothetical protein
MMPIRMGRWLGSGRMSRGAAPPFTPATNPKSSRGAAAISEFSLMASEGRASCCVGGKGLHRRAGAWEMLICHNPSTLPG